MGSQDSMMIIACLGLRVGVHHPAGADVDLKHLAGAKMRHEQQSAAGIKTRVIQPGVAARRIARRARSQ
jgi:hypothetical protein